MMSNEYDHSRLRYQLPSATRNTRPSISILLELLFLFLGRTRASAEEDQGQSDNVLS